MASWNPADGYGYAGGSYAQQQGSYEYPNNGGYAEYATQQPPLVDHAAINYGYGAPPQQQPQQPQQPQHHAHPPPPPAATGAVLTDAQGNTKFRVHLSDATGETVLVQVTLDGLKIFDASGSRQLRMYSLNMVTRWTQLGERLTVLTKCSANAEERPFALVADSKTICELIDTLTSTCLQLVEIRDAEEEEERLAADAALAARAAAEDEDEAREAERAVAAAKAAEKASEVPGLGDSTSVDFWTRADKAGWLWSQGEHIKTWRRRWHILKSGFLFRFMDDRIDPTCKPRGVSSLKGLDYATDGGTTTAKPEGMRGFMKGAEKLYLIHLVFAEAGASTSGSKMFLGAETAEERDMWLAALNSSAMSANKGGESTPARNESAATTTTSAPRDPPQRMVFPPDPGRNFNNVLPKKASTHEQLLTTLQSRYDDTAAAEQRRRASSGAVTYATAPSSAGDRWETAYAPDGRPYFFDRSTGETRWSLL